MGHMTRSPCLLRSFSTMPPPIIPPRKNAKVYNAAIAAFRRLGRSIWKRWSGYHQRLQHASAALALLLRGLRAKS